MITAPAKLMVLASVMLDFLAATVQVNSQSPFEIDYAYRIVASRSTSRLVTCLGLFRLLMKGIFGPYVL